MTNITYSDGHLTIIQSHEIIEFKVSDLDYESRQQLINSVADINGD